MFIDKFKMLNHFDDNKKEIELVSVSNHGITNFFKNYKSVKKIVMDNGDDLLNDYLVSLTSFFNIIRSSIIPYEEAISNFDYTDITRLLERIVEFSNEKETNIILEDIHKSISTFKNGGYENNLRIKLQEYLDDNARVALVNHYWSDQINRIEKSGNIDFLKYSMYLTVNEYYDQVIFIGSPSYYHYEYPYLSSIVKSNRVVYLYYDIYKGAISRKRLIANNDFSKLFEGVSISETKEQSVVFKPELESNELYVLDNSVIFNRLLREYQNKTEIQKNKLVPSYLFELESLRGILFPEKGSIRIVNKETLEVSRCQVNKVKSDDWFVLKESSEPEYLKKKAREIIGKEYDSIHEAVTSYKELLIERADELGSLEELSKALKVKGINNTIQQLKGWMYGDTIAPDSYDKILDYLGFGEDDIELLLNESKLIKSAHQSAGSYLMKNISEVVLKFGVDNLEKEMLENDSCSFEVAGMGEFVVEKVKSRYKEILYVNFSDLYKPTDSLM